MNIVSDTEGDVVVPHALQKRCTLSSVDTVAVNSFFRQLGSRHLISSCWFASSCLCSQWCGPFRGVFLRIPSKMRALAPGSGTPRDRDLSLCGVAMDAGAKGSGACILPSMNQSRRALHLCILRVRSQGVVGLSQTRRALHLCILRVRSQGVVGLGRRCGTRHGNLHISYR